MTKTKTKNIYEVKFTENKKYNPMTRTVQVEAEDEIIAKLVVASEYDSYTYNKDLKFQVPSEKHIKIDKVKKVKNPENWNKTLGVK